MDCLVQYLIIQINEGSTSINCPVACNEPMLQHEIRKYVENELFERYDRQGIFLAIEILCKQKFLVTLILITNGGDQID